MFQRVIYGKRVFAAIALTCNIIKYLKQRSETPTPQMAHIGFLAILVTLAFQIHGDAYCVKHNIPADPTSLLHTSH